MTRYSISVLLLGAAVLCMPGTGQAQGCRFLLDNCDQPEQPKPVPPQQQPAPAPPNESIEKLVECCLAYCRAINCNSPPATIACAPSFIASNLVKYAASWRSYGGSSVYGYKRSMLDGAKTKGIVVRACL
jgi:hypothetical protein